MRKKENQRVQLTKKMLKDSLINLLKSKSIQKISISEICQNANINRATFYNHYQTQFDLLNEIENDIIEQLDNELDNCPINSSDELLLRLEIICDFIKRNEEIMKLLFINNSQDSPFILKLFRVEKSIGEMPSNFFETYGQDGIDLLITFLVTGGYNMLKKWIVNDMHKSSKEMAELIFIIIQNPLSVIQTLSINN